VWFCWQTCSPSMENRVLWTLHTALHSVGRRHINCLLRSNSTCHHIFFFFFVCHIHLDQTKIKQIKLDPSALPKPNSTKINLTKPSKFTKPKYTKLKKAKFDRFFCFFKNLRYSDSKDLRCLKVLRNSCTDPYLFKLVWLRFGPPGTVLATFQDSWFDSSRSTTVHFQSGYPAQLIW